MTTGGGLPGFVPGLDGYSVLPRGRYTCTLPDFEARFVHGLPDSGRRERIYADFLDLAAAQAAHGLIVDSYWLAGSFVSAKLNPSDLDLSTVADQSRSLHLVPGWDQLILFKNRWKTENCPTLGRTLLLDEYGFVKKSDLDPDVQGYRLARGYWDDWWQRSRETKEDLARGYVEVIW